MVFAIDIGNSNIVCGVCCNDGIKFVERMRTDREKTDLEYAVLFKTVLELHDIKPEDIKGSILASVVPELNRSVMNAIEKLFGHAPLLVGPGVKTGLNIKIDDPAQLGADLVVAAVATIKEYPLPQIIFDLGTATTITGIDKNGCLVGVAITAGVRTAVNSIVSKTSQLTNIAYHEPAHAIGKNTVESMQSGAVYGTAAMMDGMIERFEEELGKCTIISTGGLSSFISPICKHEIIHDDRLLLKGLYIIYNKNC